jgi:hypothetical protein
MRTQFVITITVDAEESTDLRKATEVACDRMAEFDPTIKVLDSDIEYAN